MFQKSLFIGAGYSFIDIPFEYYTLFIGTILIIMTSFGNAGRGNARNRYIVLACTCLLTFGSYYSFDMPSILKSDLEETFIEPWAPSRGSTLYNLFYLVYAFCNMAMSLIAGVMVDKHGTRSCAVIFLALCFVGQSLFAVAGALTSLSPKARYIFMFFGRFVFGLGGGSITIVQNAITAKWFKGRNLAMAFGCTLTVSRLGSVINFSLTSLVFQTFAKKVWHLTTVDGNRPVYCAPNSTDNLWPSASPPAGEVEGCSRALAATFALGAVLILVSYIPAAIFIAFDRAADRAEAPSDASLASTSPDKNEVKLGRVDSESHDDAEWHPAAEPNPKTPAFSRWMRSVGTRMDVATALPASFWLVSLIIALFYNVIFPFLADAKDFIQLSYDMDPSRASFIAGLVYLLSMIVSPFLGYAVDYFGRRTWIVLYGTGVTIPVFWMFYSSSSISPTIPMVLLGSAYCVCASALWPSIQLLVPSSSVGIANGIATSIQMLGIGISNLSVGAIQDANAHVPGSVHGYKQVMLFFLGMGSASLVVAWILFLVERRSRERIMYYGKRDEKASIGDETRQSITEPLIRTVEDYEAELNRGELDFD